MAWNEPGGSGKDKDPWGGGDKNQGPPDLDEVVKKMQEKFGALFGGAKRSKGNGASGGGGSGVSGLFIGLLVVGFVALWAFSGFFIVDEGKRGVVLQFGKYTKTTMPGLQWIPRFIQSAEIVDIEQIREAPIGYRTSGANNRQSVTSVGRESLMLTEDENIVDIQMAVQYKIKSASDYLFNVKEPDLTLRQATESALREIIGKNNMDFVLTEGRAEIAAKVSDLIQIILDRYQTGLIVTSVNMQNAQPPEQVQAAFDDAVKAREDNERLKNEAEAYANDVIPRARGKAARSIQEAEAYKERVIAEANGESNRFKQILAEYQKAPEVTRQRLYIETMESVMHNTSKILVDVSKGNSLMYLPLDRILENRSSGTPQSVLSSEPIPSRQGQANDQPLRETTRRGGR